jgi:hypothetical protein
MMCSVACIIAAATSISAPAGDLGHRRRIADDAAVVEGRCHDAPMPAPGLSFARQEPATEAGLEQPPRDLGLVIVGGVIEQNVPDGAWLVDEKSAFPEQPPRENVGGVGFGAIRCERVVAQHPHELQQRQRSLWHLRHRQRRRRRARSLTPFNDAHRPLSPWF